VLGVEGQALVGQRRGDPLVHRLQPANGGEQAQAPAAGRQEQLAHRRRDLAGVVLVDVGDHEGLGVVLVVEGRDQSQHLGRLRHARRAGAHLGQGERVFQRRVEPGWRWSPAPRERGRMTAARSGSVGSTQWRRQAASTTRP
jgi:hypothetical protein